MQAFSNELLTTLERIMKLISTTFGEKCEVVLHEWAKGYDKSIIAIENGQVTGRKVGDCGSTLGLEILRGTVKNGDCYNYITKTQDGLILKSSTIYFKNENSEAYGALCINIDITDAIKHHTALQDFIGNYEVEDNTEFHARDVKELTEYLIKNALSTKNIPVSEMSKEDKIDIIRFLDEKGTFLITKSGDRVCEALNISKYTLYSYLDIVRTGKGKS